MAVDTKGNDGFQSTGGIRRPLLFFRSRYGLTAEEQRYTNPRSSYSDWYIDWGKAIP